MSGISLGAGSRNIPAIHRRRAEAPRKGWIFNQISGGMSVGFTTRT
jgi:hypothetical protein